MIARSQLDAIIRGYIEIYGSQKAAAKAIGVSQAYICDVCNGRREPAEKILTALGYRRVVMYEQVTR